MQSIFIEGVIVGFCIAAPVGPIAALTLQRTTSDGRLAGIATGMGAALADAFYGGLAALGVTAVSSFLADHRDLFLRAGGVILCILGLRLLLAKRFTRVRRQNHFGLIRDFLSSVALTLTNPMTLVAFAAVFAAFGIHAGRGHPLITVELVGGVFVGSAAWWLVLVGLAAVLRDRFHEDTLVWVNRGVGVFVIVVGALYLCGAAASLIKLPAHLPKLPRS
jgi:threonine/homoserine/homoserine lactone efflux protein